MTGRGDPMWSPATHGRRTTFFTENTALMNYFKSICILLLLGTLLTPITLSAAGPKEKDNDNNEAELTIQGTLVDEQNQPVADTKVFVNQHSLYFQSDKPIETTTDFRGRFAITDKVGQLKKQTLLATAPGQRMAYVNLPWKNLQSDSSLRELQLQLRPAQHFALQVVDGTGKPIANAQTGIMGNYLIWETGKTDPAGRIEYLLPEDVPIQNVVAFRNGDGLDYQAYELSRKRRRKQPNKKPALPENPIRLTLDGTQPLQVKVQESDGKPLAGVLVRPWYLQKADQPDVLNLSFYNKLFRFYTDKSGIVKFHWIPHWQTEKLTIWAYSADHKEARVIYDPQKGKGRLTIRVVSLITISDRGIFPDGYPNKKISLHHISN
ncbi:hypothetical protein Pan153_01110 [Gimesia panareensis]|uniref:Nickel uptake substrate-specific transmembrane region n=2 Tax=Gimesia panareensis TaxID=2527978 RepID=A0A518FGL7_9PLAN|nr:hypothetical protein Pan153_01110 [Gimesia panareensis]